MSSLTFANCPEAERIPSPDDRAPYVAQMMKDSGKESCKTSAGSEQSTWAAAGGFGGITLGGVGGGGFTAGGASMKATSSTTGCEQIIAIANRNYQSAQKIKCILNQKQQETNISAANINNIIFDTRFEGQRGGDLIMNCGDNGLDISQSVKVKIANITILVT
jgi:hypothetical protein